MDYGGKYTSGKGERLFGKLTQGFSIVETVYADNIEIIEEPPIEVLTSDLYTTDGSFGVIKNQTESVNNVKYNCYSIWKNGKNYRILTQKSNIAIGNVNSEELIEIINSNPITKTEENWRGYQLVYLT